MTLNEFFNEMKQYYETPSGKQKLGFFPRIYCNDGELHLSVQVGKLLYCTPRDDVGPWTHVEVGFPSLEPPAEWDEWVDIRNDDRKKTVYAYIPIEKVEAWIEEHGGIDIMRTKLEYEEQLSRATENKE